ncbi:MAG: hypothetical protein WA708_12895 [Acidobacteriaceae bacterium]
MRIHERPYRIFRVAIVRWDTFSGAYTIDDSADVTPTSSNLYGTDLEGLREQVLSRDRINQNYERCDLR